MINRNESFRVPGRRAPRVIGYTEPIKPAVKQRTVTLPDGLHVHLDALAMLLTVSSYNIHDRPKMMRAAWRAIGEVGRFFHSIKGDETGVADFTPQKLAPALRTLAAQQRKLSSSVEVDQHSAWRLLSAALHTAMFIMLDMMVLHRDDNEGGRIVYHPDRKLTCVQI